MTPGPASSTAPEPGAPLPVLAGALVLGGLGFLVVNLLSVEWTLNAQYTYGWLAPAMVLYSLWTRWHCRPAPAAGASGAVAAAVAVLALMLLPAGLVCQASPDWRLAGWGMALLAAGLALGVAWRLGGRPWGRHFLFPLLLGFGAVPWPTWVEQTGVQWLTQTNTAGVVEMLCLLGIPALQRGNLVEISAGCVGVEEACSGIRSLQAALMISLFLGEWFLLRPRRRLALCACGAGLAFVFNLGRTFFMVWIASKKGIPAVAVWHDPSGVVLLLCCFLSLWGLGAWMARKGASPVLQPAPLAPGLLPGPAAGFFLWSLAAWMLLSQALVEGWYRWHERGMPVSPAWTLRLPSEAPGYQARPIPEASRAMLRYDEGRCGVWTGPDDTRWIAFYLRWKPGRAAVQLASLHAPSVCLPAAGVEPRGPAVRRQFSIGGRPFLFDRYAFNDRGRPAFAYYCLTDDRPSTAPLASAALTTASRLEAAAAGLRNSGQRVIEIALSGCEDPERADTLTAARLNQLVVRESP